MNDKITNTKNLILEAQKKIEDLRKLFLDQHYEYLESVGIKKGSVVRVRKDRGIFEGLDKSYFDPIPIVKKMKKDGTAHGTASICIWKISDMEAER